MVGNFSTQPTTITNANTLWDAINDATVLLDNNSFCQTDGAKTLTLSNLPSSMSNDWYAIGLKFDDWVRDGERHLTSFSSTELALTYVIPKVLNAPTNLSATGASTSQIDLSWTAPSLSGTGSGEYPAVSGYRIQSSDFAFANASLPTGRTADSDVYGAITGGVDMDTAQLYLSMNTTQNILNTVTWEHDYSDSTGWTEVGSTTNISGGVWTSNSAGNNADHGFYKALGFTLSDTAWYVELSLINI